MRLLENLTIKFAGMAFAMLRGVVLPGSIALLCCMSAVLAEEVTDKQASLTELSDDELANQLVAAREALIAVRIERRKVSVATVEASPRAREIQEELRQINRRMVELQNELEQIRNAGEEAQSLSAHEKDLAATLRELTEETLRRQEQE